MIEDKTELLEGHVKHCNSKGFGFIGTRKQIDFYFHHTAFVDNWKELLRRFVTNEVVIVEFENDPTGNEGPKAKNVRFKTSYSSEA